MSGTTPNAFGTLIADARSFYADLAQNNTKAWFTEHKSHYDTALKTPAKLLLDQIAPHVAELSEGTVKTKLYRPHRDIRFSKDKTPYSLHLHMLWSPQGNGTQPGYFFGISEQYVTAGAGIMAFDKAQQTGWRAWVSEGRTHRRACPQTYSRPLRQGPPPRRSSAAQISDPLERHRNRRRKRSHRSNPRRLHPLQSRHGRNAQLPVTHPNSAIFRFSGPQIPWGSAARAGGEAPFPKIPAA
jgi:hypothetical protein